MEILFLKNMMDLKLNIKRLNKFIQDGNIFLLNTGRPYDSIIKEIIKYKIPYHYLWLTAEPLKSYIALCSVC